MLGGSPPESGFPATLNRTNSLLVYTRWPLVPTPDSVERGPQTKCPIDKPEL